MLEFFECLDADLFIHLNKIVEESGSVLKSNELESALSSFHYESSSTRSIVSIYRSLIQNHPFVDGNKRTATLFLETAVSYLQLNLTVPSSELDIVAVKTASDRLALDAIYDILFGPK